MKAKLICTNTSTVAFDDHRIDLQSPDVDITVKFKDRSMFDSIQKGDTVSIDIHEVEQPKAAKSGKGKGKGK